MAWSVHLSKRKCGLIGVREHQHLEFKERTYSPKNPTANTEMAKDVSSFANVDGGVLILGMEEDGEGRATTLVPQAEAEAEGRRLISTCRVRLMPIIEGLETGLVPVGNGHVIVVRIPESYLDEPIDDGLQRVLDPVWNAFGYERCHLFENGKYKRGR